MSLRRLLTWPTPLSKPDLAVVFVDADGERGRYQLLKEHVHDRPDPQPPVVFGVPVQEFEAWLIADERSLRTILGYSGHSLPAPESLPTGEAKRRIQELLATFPQAEHRARLIELSLALDLQRVADICPAFARFRADLRSVLIPAA